ncbi:DNA adenine methylase [Lacrimispora sp.]|uniref:DNA adenine methylase n=1 Tax=Lacrimispora sp. TaxID=2719234 RepID=UPI0028645E5E|nr:DNA adenine methylase [Lacrimispora sp.]MDR7810560.1 DNA adenine methylase [Lacrimispora sp.]
MSGREYVISPLNYTGGKGKLLSQILPLFPEDMDVFVDLFCGGCNVGINVDAQSVIYNDSLKNVIGIYKTFKNLKAETIIKKIDALIDEYGFSKTSEHSFAYYNGDNEKGVSAYNRNKFSKLRDDFNTNSKRNSQYYIMLYTLIVFGFNNQIRFNSAGKYNLPVGKRDFNDVIRNKLIIFINELKAQNCRFSNKDFRKVQINNLTENSLVYVDPPYLISTATYNENGGWAESDEQALLEYLDELDNNRIKFALSNVLRHKGKTNSILLAWLEEHENYNIHHLTKDYSNSNYQVKENDTRSDEILVTNY